MLVHLAESEFRQDARVLLGSLYASESGAMTAQRSHVLIAVQAEELFRRFENYIACDVRACQKLQVQHCLPVQLDSKLRENHTDAVILIQLRFHDDLTAAVRRWKSLRPDLQIVFCFRRPPGTRALLDLTSSGALDVIETEVEAIREPLIQQILGNLQRRLDEVRISAFERLQARNSLAEVGIVGESAETQNLFMQILHAARLSCPVLISGEPGSGKRLVAHAIHALGRRSSRQIVTVDCQSLSPPLLRMALFGRTALAASANSSRATLSPGRGAMVVAAQYGTLLLHEVSGLPWDMQSQLQKLLESAESPARDTLDVRLLSTSSRRMDELVERKAFRADLCYRVTVLSIEIPPLRSRAKDVPLLARHFLSRFERDGRALSLSEEAADALSGYAWPENLSELKSAVEFAASHSADEVILPSDLPESIRSGGAGNKAPGAHFESSELNLARLERQAILRALHLSGLDKTKAAQLLGIGKTTMYRKLNEMSGKVRS